MKTSKKSAGQASHEECGVWLDAVELKGKAKQKQFSRPISKLLNPLAKGSGYSLSVALNFTQTKIQMPNTKQSSISSFFAGQRRVLNKMASSDVPNTVLPETLSPSTSPGCSSLPLSMEVVTKRKRDMNLEVLGLQSKEEHHVKTFSMDFERERVGSEWKSERVDEKEYPAWLEDNEKDYLPHLNVDHGSEKEEAEGEVEEPERKRKFTRSSPPRIESDSQGERCNQEEPWSAHCSPQYSQELTDPGDLMIRYNYTTRDSESQYEPTHPMAKRDNNLRSVFLESLQSEEGFGAWLGVQGRTSTQKSFESTCASLEDDEKENNRPSSPSKSPNKNLSLTPLRPISNQAVAKPNILLPKKHITERPWKKAEVESTPLSLASQHKWSKSSSSPLKKRVPERPLREVEEDSLAMLFTQDSEGFRVMAHRGLVGRSSPMKDQTNLVSTGREKRTATYNDFVEEEEEMLFTQDSQGNIVIKH